MPLYVVRFLDSPQNTQNSLKLFINLSPLENVKMRTVPGGPSPAMVEIARDNIKEFLNEEFEKKGI